nr:glycerophosphodiester phosphodiesterase family protein [Paenibacillus sabuli]
MPTLREVLQLVKARGLYLNIEVKDVMGKREQYRDLALRAAELVEAGGTTEQVIFSSFNHTTMVRLKQAYPHMKAGLLHFAGLHLAGRYARSAGADALHPLYIGVNEDMIREAHAAGIAVHAWTVNDRPELGRMLACGVDAIITDVPDVCAEVKGAGV